MIKKSGKCCLCGGDYVNYGNNPFPYFQTDNKARCCTICDRIKVLPARLIMMSLESEQFSGDIQKDIETLFNVFDNSKYQAAQYYEFMQTKYNK